MKILVCVKQVPETDAVIEIDDDSGWVQAAGSDELKMNRYDESAVEEAIRIKETLPDTKIDIISVGPQRSETVIKRAIGMGADNGIHIVTENEGYLDPFLAASWIAVLARKTSYDLILAGVMSEDAMQGLVGPLIAENLSRPCATAVIFARLSPEKNQVYVEREIEGGLRERLELNLPTVLTIQTGINTPRYPSLSNLLRANKMELTTIDAEKLEQPVGRQTVVRVAYPRKLRDGIFLKGSQKEKAAQLLQILCEKSFIN
jgi:electron transfer flavoprotein beta subunit